MLLGKLQQYYLLKFSTLYKKIASNTIAQIVSKMLTALISIVLIGLLTKYLPMELYGSYNKVYSYLGIFAFLADLWLYTIAIREISAWHTAKEKIIGNIMTLRTILGLWIWVLAIFIALVLPGYHDTLTLIAIAIVGAFTLVSLINSSLLALMQSQMKMEFSLVSLISGKLLNLGLIALALLYIFQESSEVSFAFLSVFIAGFFGIVLNTFLNYWYLKKTIEIRYLFDWEYIAHIFKISLPYGLALFLSVVYFKVDVIILSLLESPEKADISIALYGLPMKIIEVLMVLWGFYLNSLLPTLTEKYKNTDVKALEHIFGLSLKVLLSFGFLIFLLGNLFASEVISIIATPDYLTPSNHLYSSLDAFRVVLAVLLFYFLSLCCIYMLIASERQGILLWVNLAVTLINIIGNIIFIPYFSFMGAAYITLVSQIFLLLCTGYIILKDIKIPKIYIFSCIKTWFFGTLLFFLFYFISFWKDWGDILTLFIVAPMFLAMYIAMEYLFSKKLLKASNMFSALK